MYASLLLLLRMRTHHRHWQGHYHIIPAPKLSSSTTSELAKDLNQTSPPTVQDMHREEYESRDELDKDDAHELVEGIKAHL